MGTGYTRNDTTNNIADGNVINASDLDGEFDAIQAAFNGTTGHSHDGTTGEGPQIGTAGIANGAVTNAKIANDAVTLGTQTTGNYVATITPGEGIDVTGSGSENAGVTISAEDASSTNKGVASFNATDFSVTAGAVSLAKDPVVTLTGAVTGSGTMTNLGSVSIATTATSDPTLTLAGDVSGSATFTNLGNATLTATVADDSHNHVISNVDGLQTALDAKVAKSGDSMTGNLSFGDSNKAIFGAGSDLKVYHSGSDSWVQDTGTGNLYLDTNGNGVNISYNGSTENMATFTVNGAAQLYYDNSAKLATTSTGVSVTGTVAATAFTGDGSALTGIDSLPSQTGNAGKYLTTNGSTASWDTIAATTFPFYKEDGSSDTIAITSGQFPFYKADGSQDNIGVS